MNRVLATRPLRGAGDYLVSGIIPKTPAKERADALADLAARIEKAEAIGREAEVANDPAKLRRAVERWHFRIEQHGYLSERPADALCPACIWGDEDWSPDLLTLDRHVYACLSHREPFLTLRVAELMREYDDDVSGPCWVAESEGGGTV